MSRLDIIFVGGELNEGNYVEDFESLLFLGGLNLISCVLIFFPFTFQWFCKKDENGKIFYYDENKQNCCSELPVFVDDDDEVVVDEEEEGLEDVDDDDTAEVNRDNQCIVCHAVLH